jgi:Outer membrane protein beta-barrel domain
MHRKALGIVLAALLVSAGPVSAQGIKFMLGGGLTVPVSDYKNVDGAQNGWMGMLGAAVSFPVLPIGVRLEGLYGQNPHTTATDTTDKIVLYGGAASVVVKFGIPGPLSPYIIGSAGYLDRHYSPGDNGNLSTDEWKAVYGGGVGLSLSLVVIGAFIEGRYLARSSTRFITAMGGIQIGI